NKLTDTDVGELFVIRNAGNTLPSSDAMEGDADKATVEYAVKALNIKEIVVCGHTGCGAVNALCGGVDEKELPLISKYLERLGPLKEKITEKGADLDEAIKMNVQMQIDNLMSYDFVKSRVEGGELSIEGWIYNIGNGEVEIVK
ncbi:MAG: carbonic anhydrase, partial [Bacteriovoracaceae bacterium]|nr:carbonic anhydrase [Bacteriovoracaceae bacterium]